MPASSQSASQGSSFPHAQTSALQRGSSNRGFASMDPERQRYVGSDAGKAQQDSGKVREADRKASAMPGTTGSWQGSR